MKTQSPHPLVRALACGAFASVALLVPAEAQTTYTFQPTTGTSNWNDTVTPVWNPAAFPDAVGDVAEKSANSSATVNQNESGGVTVGAIIVSGAATNTWTINAAQGITLDAVGSGPATISRTAANAGTRIDFSAGTLTLADDLVITNSGGDSASGSFRFNNLISGTGDITINNSSNVTNGRIRFEGNANDFVGSVELERGYVTFNNASSFGGSGNAMTIGTVGAATLLNVTTGASNLANSITVESFGATLGSTSATPADTTFSGTVTLNGTLSTSSSRTASNALVFSNVLSGQGDLTIGGGGVTRLTAVNTFTGDTTIALGSSLSLTSSSEIRFVLDNGGISNQVLGGGSASFAGIFRLDVSGFTPDADSWTLVDVGTLSESFDAGTFNLAFVGGPTFSNDGGGLYSSGDWSFDAGTGTLTVVPEPTTWALIGGGLLALIAYRRRFTRA